MILVTAQSKVSGKRFVKNKLFERNFMLLYKFRSEDKVHLKNYPNPYPESVLAYFTRNI